MTPRSFWVILLKILGLWLMFRLFTEIPQLFSFFIYIVKVEHQGPDTLTSLGAMVLGIGVYLWVLRTCLFKTEWLIDTLQLEKGLAEEKLNLNLPGPMVLRIATIVAGCLIAIESTPQFFIELFKYIQKRNILRVLEADGGPSAGWMIYKLIKAIIGFLLVANSAQIATWIGSKEKSASANAIVRED